MSGCPNDGAMGGKLGALRWALVQRPDDSIAHLALIHMGAVGNRSWKCFLSVSNLAKLVDCDPRKVQRKLRYLEQRGYIEHVLEGSRRLTRVYRLYPEREDG